MRFNLLQFPFINRLLRSRWPQFLLTILALLGFIFAILSGWLGTPVGNRNFSIVMVWIAWWALLILAVVPLFGRGWCSVCPIPLVGDWLQRGSLMAPSGGGWGLGRRWPNKLRNIWLQNAAFLLLALFSATILTQPSVTAAVLAVLFCAAIGVSLLFERRAFCRYLCPVGGFIGLYSQAAPIELRVVDPAVCAGHKDKTCFTGNTAGYGCPWQVYPGGLVKNTNCGLCMECLRTCPHENIAINLRSFGADLGHKRGLKKDELYKAAIMLASALAYSAVFTGPWGWLKSAVYPLGTPAWFLYTAAFLLLALVVLPGLFWLLVRLGLAISRSQQPARFAVTSLGDALVPLGLSAWVAFSLAFVFANFSYVWPALSDPLGRGWDLLGLAGMPWTPYLGEAVPGLQVLVLLVGLAWALRVLQKSARELVAQQRVAWLMLPPAVFCLVVTLTLLGVLLA